MFNLKLYCRVGGSMKKSILLIITILLSFCFSQNINAITRDEFEDAFREVAHAYYARGTSIQYNSFY